MTASTAASSNRLARKPWAPNPAATAPPSGVTPTPALPTPAAAVSTPTSRPALATPVPETAALSSLGLTPEQQRNLAQARQLALQGDNAQAADLLRQLGSASGLSAAA